jgi:hypothetical protein
MSFWIEALILFAILIVNRLAFVYLLNRKWQLSFSKNPSLMFLYFIGTAFIISVLFWEYASQLFAPDSVISIFTCLVVLTVINPWIYDRIKVLKKKPIRLSRAHPDQQFLLIEDRYLLSKTGDVISQQMAAGVLILIMAQAGVPFETLVPLFAGIFFISHFHMFFSTHLIWALYFSLFATLGGFVLPFLVLQVDGGIYYAIAIHMLWYVGSGAFFGTLEYDTNAKRT